MNTQKRKTVACILDGNRRFAKQESITKQNAYRKGLQTLAQFVTVAHKYGYTDVIAYAFSADNWNRSDEDVEQIFSLLRQLKKEEQQLLQNELNIRITVLGDLTKFPQDIQEYIHETESKTSDNNDITLWLCISYNGRDDIVRATTAVVEQGKAITKETIAQSLATAGIPDPDVLIRTGGHHRLSGFLLWEIEYTELIFTETLWPALTKEEMEKIFTDAEKVVRNYGT